jgi:hypothetical protein
VLSALDAMASGFRADPETAPLLEDGPKVLGVDEITAGQFTVLLQARTRPENRYRVARALRLSAMRRLRSEGIALHAPGPSDGGPAPPGSVPHAGGGAPTGERQ